MVFDVPLIYKGEGKIKAKGCTFGSQLNVLPIQIDQCFPNIYFPYCDAVTITDLSFFS